MGDSRVQVDGKSSSILTPGFKPEESSFLKQRYQDQVEAETTSPTAEKQLSTSGQATPTPPPSDPPPVSHSFGRVSVLPIQAKLTIGQPNDKYEQEADRVAEQVMRMPEPGSPAAAITRPVRSPVVQRLCTECEEELQRQPLEEEEDEEKMLQAKAIVGLTTPIIQRQRVESEEEEEDPLQMKPLVSQITPLIQRQSSSSEEEDEETVQTKPLSYKVSPLVQRQVEASEEEEEEESLQTKPLVSRISPLIQRMDEQTEEDEEKLQTKPLTCPFSPLVQRMSEPTEEEDEEEKQTVRTKENPGQAPSVTSTLESRLNASKGSGQSLPEKTRSFMESRFGHDFSQVRVHTDPQAAQDLNARAFTRRQDIYFGAGQYQPHTPGGQQLLAHELTHVVQQGSASPASGTIQPAVQRSPKQDEIIQRESAVTSETADNTSTAPVAPAAGDVAPMSINLKQMKESKFKPPEEIATWLDSREKQRGKGKAGKVKVKYGKAEGLIEIQKHGRKYKISKDQSIPFQHPLFARLAEIEPGLQPHLILLSGEVLKGYIGLPGDKAGRNALRNKFKQFPELLGLTGFDLGGLSFTNSFSQGSLNLGIKNFKVNWAKVLSGTLSVTVDDEEVTDFKCALNLKSIKGLGSGKLDIQGSPDKEITGKGEAEVTWKSLTGKIDLAWDGETFIAVGEVAYQGEKLSGVVILKLMDKKKAVELEEGKKAPAEKPTEPAEPAKEAAKKPGGKAPKADYVAFGEGTLDFQFNDWLTGKAQVIIDQKGHLTIIGEITPQAEVPLFDQKDYVKELFKIEPRASYGIPVVGNVFIFGNISLSAFAKIGPGKLYKISAEGTYSTDPKKSTDFKIQASLNISAAAGIKLRGEAGAGLEVLDHDIKAGAGIDGIAGIRGYAEATPVIGYREQPAAEAEDKKGEFFISGDVEIASQLFLGLQGDLFVELDSPWWSPAPDKKWTWPLGQKEWPLGKSYGVVASVDYVIGSNQFPSVELKPVDFSADKFLTDLYNDKAKPKSDKGEQQGKWKEKNSKEAEPPKSGQKGNAQPGKLAEQSAPNSAAAAASKPKKKEKPATLNARTADGKTVKEYQDKAAKEGKKPVAKEPAKGTAKEQPTAKDKAKQKTPTADIGAAKGKVKTALKTELPNGARQVEDVNKVLGKIANQVKPALTKLRAAEVAPGKPKNEGAIGFKVKAKSADNKDVLIDSVRYSKAGGTLNHEERWKAGVKGVKRAVKQLEKRGISKETITAQFSKWKSEFGFKSLTLNTKKTPWVIEGEMSPGQEVATVRGGLVARFSNNLKKSHPSAQADLQKGLEQLPGDNYTDWSAVKSALIASGEKNKAGKVLAKPILQSHTFGNYVHKEQAVKKAKAAVLAVEKNGKPVPTTAKQDPDTWVVDQKRALHQAKGIYKNSKSHLQEQFFLENAENKANETLEKEFIEKMESEGLGVDPRLKEFFTAKQIVNAMKTIATGDNVHGIDRKELEKLWESTDNRKHLKAAFRNAHEEEKGQHEWIPTNFIPNVIERAASEADAEKAAQWIDLHHELRTDTSWVIFNPEQESGTISDAEGNSIKTLVGHTGALYVEDLSNPGNYIQMTVGQGPWHDKLRNAFSSSSNPAGAIKAIQSVFSETVWNGSTSSLEKDMYKVVYYRSRSGDKPTSLASLATEQDGNFKEINKWFNKMKGNYRE
ncbi:MAG: DUF4157 domain-containing protein [Xenococcaceae cyanobacterium MO_167.B52]|nr:DUF4157 domain-containing protein [Xenococcaceae cyanobacterium MO_167.B52]